MPLSSSHTPAALGPAASLLRRGALRRAVVATLPNNPADYRGSPTNPADHRGSPTNPPTTAAAPFISLRMIARVRAYSCARYVDSTTQQ